MFQKYPNNRSEKCGVREQELSGGSAESAADDDTIEDICPSRWAVVRLTNEKTAAPGTIGTPASDAAFHSLKLDRSDNKSTPGLSRSSYHVQVGKRPCCSTNHLPTILAL